MRSVLIAASAAAFIVTGLPIHAQAARGCDPGNAGLTLPPGFCAGVYATGVPQARHMAVAPNGDVFIIGNPMRGRGRDPNAPQSGVYRLRDSDHAGKAASV